MSTHPAFRPLFNTSESVSLETKVRGHYFTQGPQADQLVCLRCGHSRDVRVADLTRCSGVLTGPHAALLEQPLLDEAA